MVKRKCAYINPFVLNYSYFDIEYYRDYLLNIKKK